MMLFAVLLEEVLGAGEGYLVDVAVNFLGVESDAVVADGQSACLLVNFDVYLQIAQLTLEVAEPCQGAQFLTGVDGVADKLAQEYLVVRV